MIKNLLNDSIIETGKYLAAVDAEVSRATRLFMDLVMSLMDSDDGVSEDVYLLLVNLMECLPVDQASKREFRNRVKSTDGRWYFKTERTGA